MIKKFVSFFILAVALLSFLNLNYVQADDLKNKSNAFRVSNDINTDLGKEKFDSFWTPQNEDYLDISQKEKLNIFKDKVNNGIVLSVSEKNKLKEMKSNVIKTKLGDEKFQELQKLIEKRESSTELTLPERTRLYELNKEARN